MAMSSGALDATVVERRDLVELVHRRAGKHWS
jgi:hypothetical protein